jgi:FtsP/CotA-like multicopper oxidase with cupredoxin domain
VRWARSEVATNLWGAKGHDFFILGRSPPPENPLAPGSRPAIFNRDTDIGALRFDNPPRRDATMIPGFGWLSIAFKNDNPGAWLFHCHVAVRIVNSFFPSMMANE